MRVYEWSYKYNRATGGDREQIDATPLPKVHRVSLSHGTRSQVWPCCLPRTGPPRQTLRELHCVIPIGSD